MWRSRPWNFAEMPLVCSTPPWPGLASPTARRLGGGPIPSAACTVRGLSTQRRGVGGHTRGDNLHSDLWASLPPPPFRTTRDTQSPNCVSVWPVPDGWWGRLPLAFASPCPPPPLWPGAAGRSSVPIRKAGSVRAPFPTGGSMILSSELDESQELELSELAEEVSDSWPGGPPWPPPSTVACGSSTTAPKCGRAAQGLFHCIRSEHSRAPKR